MVHSKIRSRWLMVVVLTLVAAFVPSSTAHAEASQYGFATVSRRHFDALALKGSVPTNWALAYQLAEYRPDDYGYPLVVDGVVVVQARGAAAQRVALDMASGGSIEFEHAYGKASRLTFAPSDGSIRVEQTQRVVAHEQKLTGEIASLGISPEHHAVGLKGVSVSPWDGRYVVTVHNFTETFATALRARVAPELVLVALDDDPTPTSIASCGDDYPTHDGIAKNIVTATNTGPCIKGGDSGGPVYTKDANGPLTSVSLGSLISRGPGRACRVT